MDNMITLQPGGPRKDYSKQEQAELLTEEEFPAYVFPGIFGDLINESNKALNFPKDYTGTSLLVAVSTLIGKTARVEVKKGWTQYPAIYAALVGGAGATKSHPVELAFDPLGDVDYAILKEYEKKLKLYEDFQALPRKEKQGKDEPVKPFLEKAILHDATPEVLALRLYHHSRGCAMVTDELATQIIGMNNYSKGDRTSIYLSLWNNKTMSVDRISSASYTVKEPFLSIIGTVQPRVIPRLFPPEKVDNGFLQRFLFAYPEHAEKSPINDHEMNDKVISRYNDFVLRFVNDFPASQHPETGLNQPRTYTWSADAKDFFYKWSKNNTDLVNENSDTVVGEVISKFDMHFIRIALILQIMLENSDTPTTPTATNYSFQKVSLCAVQGAAKICDYYLKCSFKVLDLLSKSKLESTLPSDKINLFNALPDTFSAKIAKKIGEELEMNERTVERFIANTTLFKKGSYGSYSKIQKT